MKTSTKSQPDKITKLRENLVIDETDLLTSAQIQPVLFGKACRYRVETMETRQLAELDLEGLQAGVGVSLREEAAGRGEKITERGVQEQLELNKDVVAAKVAMFAAQREEEAAKLMVEAYRHRRDSVRTMTDMMTSEQISLNDGSKINRHLQEKLKARFPKG